MFDNGPWYCCHRCQVNAFICHTNNHALRMKLKKSSKITITQPNKAFGLMHFKNTNKSMHEGPIFI
jgi:hypothetical protein